MRAAKRKEEVKKAISLRSLQSVRALEACLKGQEEAEAEASSRSRIGVKLEGNEDEGDQ